MKTWNPPAGLGFAITTDDINYLYEAIVDLVKASIAPFALENNNDFFRLQGGVWSKVGDTYSVTEGYYYYNGEIYKIGVFEGTSATEVPVLTIDPVIENTEPHQTHDGNSFVGTHDIKVTRIIQPVMGASGSGVADWDEVKEVFEADWTEAVLLNGWETDDDLPSAGTYHNFQYKKEGRKVFLRGVLYNGSTPSSNTAFQLPVGFRPLKQQDIIVSNNVGDAQCMVVRVDGSIEFNAANSAFVSDNTFFFID